VLHNIDVYPEDLGLSSQPKLLSEKPTIHPSSRILHSQIGSWTEIGPNSTVVESVIDDYSYAAGDAHIIYADIGKFCSIASHVRINPGNHPMDRVTQHHLTYRRRQYDLGSTDESAFFDWRRSAHCRIGHDVWLGHGAIILPGVSVGTGAVIGAGAVVSKDIGPYEVAVGVPARSVRARFPDAVVQALLASAWWEWDRATLEARFDDLLDVSRFLARYS